MDWNKAKNLIMIFLLLLNIILFTLLLYETDRYTLTFEQENAIITVLSKNHVVMYANILKEYKPKREIEMHLNKYDHSFLLETFMKDAETVEKTFDQSKFVAKTKDETLTVENNIVTYKNSGMGKTPTHPNSAESLCLPYLKHLEEAGINFVLDGKIIETDSGTLVKYSQKYRNDVISSNYIHFLVTDKGVSRIDFYYFKPVNFVGKERDICSADEALFTALIEIKNKYGQQPVIIEDMDFVYYQAEEPTDNNIVSKAIPCYRIFISEAEEPFLVNAYLNIIV